MSVLFALLVSTVHKDQLFQFHAQQAFTAQQTYLQLLQVLAIKVVIVLKDQHQQTQITAQPDTIAPLLRQDLFHVPQALTIKTLNSMTLPNAHLVHKVTTVRALRKASFRRIPIFV